MLILSNTLSRRMFVKRGIQFLASLVFLKSVQPSTAVRSQAPEEGSVPTGTYGAGLYGQGPYPGYKSYLPHVSQEGE